MKGNFLSKYFDHFLKGSPQATTNALSLYVSHFPSGKDLDLISVLHPESKCKNLAPHRKTTESIAINS